MPLVNNTGAWTDSISPSKKRHLSMTATEYAKVTRYARLKRRLSPNASQDSQDRSTYTRAPLPSTSWAQQPVSWSLVPSPGSSNKTGMLLTPVSSIQTRAGDLDGGASSPYGTTHGSACMDSMQWSPSNDNNAIRNWQSADPRFDFFDDMEDLLEDDFVLIPPTPKPDTKLLNLGRMLGSIRSYLDNGFTITGMAKSPTAMFSDKPLSPVGQLFWSELKNGIYLHKVQSLQLAAPALNRACEIAPQVLSDTTSFDLTFLKELFLTLSPVNTRICPNVRKMLLQYLSTLAYFKLKPSHPIAVICHELQNDQHDREVSERGLACMIDVLRARPKQMNAEDQSFPIECAMIALLRRDGDIAAAAHRAKNLVQETQRQLPPSWQQMDRNDEHAKELLNRSRMAATELAHVRMDQRGEHYKEATELSIFVLTGHLPSAASSYHWPPTPSSCTSFIRDKKSVNTLEDLAKIYEEQKLIGPAIEWLVMAETLAMETCWAMTSPTVTAHITEKLRALREQQMCI